MSLTKVVYYVGDQDTPYLVKVITIKQPKAAESVGFDFLRCTTNGVLTSA